MRGMYDRMRKYADSFGDDEYTALWDEAELEFESGSLVFFILLDTHRVRARFCVRRSHGDCRRLCAQANHSKPGALARSGRSFETFSRSRNTWSVWRVLRSFSPTLVYGGHGEPIRDYEELFHRYFRAFQDRQSQVIAWSPKPG